AGERQLNAVWRGAWVVSRIAAHSNCDGRYTNNQVNGDLVSGHGRQLFERGELGRVKRINLNRRNIEVFIDLVEPLLVEYQDGPFVLYDEISCKIELRIPRPPGNDVAFDAAIAAALLRHTSPSAAEASPEWNQRRRDPYPEGHEETLAEYEAWQAEQYNLAVQAALDESISTAARLMGRIENDTEYLAGFGAGIDHARREYFSDDCDTLLSMTRYGFVHNAPDGSSSGFEDGYEDGQLLFLHVERSAHLGDCFLVPLPGSPPR
ncbi:MAG: hypothetical protein O7A04_02910, partial [Acidobacteria bacterium]|nr:hypothetical protein [Acidobacteriota bacterium]